MVGPAGSVGRIAVRREHDVGTKPCGALDRIVEIVDLEPERHAVAVRPRRGVADPAVVVLDVEAVQLQHERPIAK
jgi:hypothetical protein